MKKKFESLFNNEKFSDFKIIFEASGNKVHAHKNILTSSSEYFEKLIENGAHEHTFDKNTNEELLTNIIKFFYTGSFDVTKEENAFLFTLEAQKLKKKLKT